MDRDGVARWSGTHFCEMEWDGMGLVVWCMDCLGRLI